MGRPYVAEGRVNCSSTDQRCYQFDRRNAYQGGVEADPRIMRLALVPPSALTPEPRPLYDDMKPGIAVEFTAFTTIRDDGTILNPWSAWLHEPELGTAIWGVTKR